MKQDHILKAEQEAREACEGTDMTAEQIQSFLDRHVANELERETQKAKYLQRPKRNAELTKALTHIAVDPWRLSREKYYQPDEHYYIAQPRGEP